MTQHDADHTGTAARTLQHTPTDDLSALGELAEHFSERVRRGEAPSVEAYARQHPELARRIRDLFPMLLLLEGASADHSAVLAPGRPFGRYRVEREIGRGGMGIVFLAVHQALQKRVALKVLPGRGPGDALALERFLREAQTAAALHHTNIVPVFDVGQVEQTVYYAMQYIEGVGLDQVLRQIRTTSSDGDVTLPSSAPVHSPAREAAVGATPSFGGLDWCRWAAQVALEAAEGLAHAHARGVVHRDIKPSNLLLDAQGRVWITDFGLAYRPDAPALSQPGLPIGTPRYMSPEQAAAGPSVDARSDVYSLGATLYELLAGRPAYDADTVEGVLYLIRHQEPAALRTHNPRVPRDLETVVHKAMARRPEDRYASATQLADDLRRWLRHEPVQARRIGPLGQALRWARRNPAVASLTAAVAALLVLVAASATALAMQEHAGAERERQARGQVVAALDDANRVRGQERQARLDAEKDRDALARALRRAEGLRLVLQGQLRVGSDPQQALLLAVEGALRHRAPQTDASLLAILDHFHATRVLTTPVEVIRTAFSRDGRFVLTCNGRGQTPIHLWDAATGKQLLQLRFPQVAWNAILSPDARFVLTVARDGTARLWETASGKEVHRFEGMAPVVDEASFSPDSSQVVLTGNDNRAVVWDLATGRKRHTLIGHKGVVRQARFSPDGTRIATTANDQTVRLWDAATGKLLVTLDWLTRRVDVAILAPPGSPRRSEVRSIAFRADGRQLITSDTGGMIHLWDVATGKEVAAHRFGEHAVLSPDGTRIVTWMSGAQFAYLSVRDAVTGRELTRCEGHKDSLSSVAFHPDGKTLVSGSYDATVRLWDVHTGKERVVLRGHTGRVLHVAFAPDGERILSGGEDGTARIWNVLSEKERSTRQGDPLTQLARVSPDGTRVLIPSYRYAVGVWDVATARARFERTASLLEPTGGTRGRYLLLRDGNGVRILETATGKDHGVLQGHTKPIRSAAFSPDGKHLVTASADGTARIRSLTAGEPQVVLRGHTDEVNSAVFDAAGKRVLTTSADRTARVWDAETGKVLIVLKGHTDQVTAGHFAAKDRVVTWSRDQKAGIWDVASGKRLATIADVDWLRPVGLSADGTRMLVMGYKDRRAVRLHRIEDGTEERVLTGHDDVVEAACFRPDGLQVATVSSDGTGRLWDSATGKEQHRLTGHKGAVRGVAYSGDGRRVLTVGGDAVVRIHDVRTGKVLRTALAHEGRVLSAAFTEDGKGVVAATIRTNFVLWDTQTRKEIATQAGHWWQIWDADYRADGQRVVTASLDGTARIWDVRTGRSRAILVGHEGRVVQARFSPDGTRVATASTDGTGRLWDAATGKELAVLQGTTSEVDAVVFAPDGRRLLTRSKDGKVRLWDGRDGRALRTLEGHEGILSAACFSPDGKYVLTAATGWEHFVTRYGKFDLPGQRRGKDFTARLWNVVTGKAVLTLRHEQGVSAALFHPSGKQMLTCSGQEMRLWDVAKGVEIRRWKVPQPVYQAEWTPDGQRVLTAAFHGAVRLWDPTTGKLAAVVHPGPVQSAGFTRQGEQIWTLNTAGDFRLLPTDPLAMALRLKTRELTPAEREEFEVPQR